MYKNKQNQNGFGVVESMLASIILLFVLSTGFILLNSVLVSMALDNERDKISNLLDERFNIYRLTGVFDETEKDGIQFKKTVVIGQMNEAQPKKYINTLTGNYSLGERNKKAKEAAAKAANENLEITY